MFNNLQKDKKGERQRKNRKEQKLHNQMTDLNVKISIISLNLNGLNKLIQTDCMNGIKNNSTRYNLQKYPSNIIIQIG